MYRSTGWRPGWIWYSKLVLLIEQKYVGGISRKLVLVVMIRKGPWASLWCPWRVPAGSSNAPRSQQLLCAYLTIPNPPAHQYCCLPVKTSMKLKVFMFSSKLLHRVTSDQICEHKRLLNFLHLSFFLGWQSVGTSPAIQTKWPNSAIHLYVCKHGPNEMVHLLAQSGALIVRSIQFSLSPLMQLMSQESIEWRMMLINVEWCWIMLIDADWCWLMHK